MQRIESGRLRGRRLAALPRGTAVRPTSARMRAAIFDRLQAEITGARVLDLFAGSGALSFEALSRGAREAVLVEQHPVLVRFLRRQTAELGLQVSTRLHRGDALRFLQEQRGTQPPFDLILLDPPYGRPELAAKAARAVVEGRWLAAEGVLVCERARIGGKCAPIDWPHELELQAERKHGQAVLEFLGLQGSTSEQGPNPP